MSGQLPVVDVSDHGDRRLRRTGMRLVVFGLVLMLVLAVVARSDGEYAHVARHFLSNLLRQLF